MNTRQELSYKLYLQKESGFIRTSYQNEFSRYVDIQRGDVSKVKENFRDVRKNFYNGKGTLSDDPVRNLRYHMIISTAIIARICVEGGMNHDEAYTLSDIYIQTVDKMTSLDEIMDYFEKMQIEFATSMKENRKGNAISLHIRKCIDYIYDHLHEKISIDSLAEYTGLNSTYLSKLFASETGNTIHNFINDTRIETAKNMLVHSDFTYVEIASSLGFPTQSSFIAMFKKKTGDTPKQYRDKNYGKEFTLP